MRSKRHGHILCSKERNMQPHNLVRAEAPIAPATIRPDQRMARKYRFDDPNMDLFSWPP